MTLTNWLLFCILVSLCSISLRLSVHLKRRRERKDEDR